jgi:general secretion pathway protein F
LRQAETRLASGIPLATALSAFPHLFPQNVISVVSVGERSGKLEESFMYLATYFDHEVDIQTKQLPTLIEPLLLIVIGAVVAFVALAVISPIYELTAGLSSH